MKKDDLIYRAMEPVPYKLTNMLTELRMLGSDELADNLEPSVRLITGVIAKACAELNLTRFDLVDRNGE